MTTNIISPKSVAYAIRIVNLYKYLSRDQSEYVLSKQLLRSGTAIGALIREAEHAESKADFLHKMNISLKEANEADYWLMLLHQCKYLKENEYESLRSDGEEIIRLLASIVKTTKKNLGR